MNARRRRSELLKHVQHKLDMMPRTPEPKVGPGVRNAELRTLLASAWEEAQQQVGREDWAASVPTLEYVLMQRTTPCAGPWAL